MFKFIDHFNASRFLSSLRAEAVCLVEAPRLQTWGILSARNYCHFGLLIEILLRIPSSFCILSTRFQVSLSLRVTY